MKISLCIICKNEEKKIARCIKSVKAVVDEIIVVDTGSDDKTIDIVRELGATVFEIPWENDFSQAKNFAIAQSTGDWIIFLDADEYFTESSKDDVRGLIAEANSKQKDYILCEILNHNEDRITSTFKTVRIFKHSSNIMYEGRVHERICKKEGEMRGIDFINGIQILHDGYCDTTMLEKDKVDRNLKLLLEELKEKPRNGNLCYYLMQTYNGKDDIEKVWEYAQKAIEYNNISLDGAKVGVYERLLHVCTLTNKDFETTQKIYNEAIMIDKEYPDFEFRYGEYFYKAKEYVKSAKCLLKCLEKMERYNGYAVSGLMGDMVKVLDLLVQCYLLEEKYGEAVPVLVKLLRVDRYQFKALYNLIKILETSDSGSSIGGFLGNLYDYTNLKDQMVLVQMSRKIQNEDLINYISGRIGDDVKNQLDLKH